MGWEAAGSPQKLVVGVVCDFRRVTGCQPLARPDYQYGGLAGTLFKFLKSEVNSKWGECLENGRLVSFILHSFFRLDLFVSLTVLFGMWARSS